MFARGFVQSRILEGEEGITLPDVRPRTAAEVRLVAKVLDSLQTDDRVDNLILTARLTGRQPRCAPRRRELPLSAFPDSLERETLEAIGDVVAGRALRRRRARRWFRGAAKNLPGFLRGDERARIAACCGRRRIRPSIRCRLRLVARAAGAGKDRQQNSESNWDRGFVHTRLQEKATSLYRTSRGCAPHLRHMRRDIHRESAPGHRLRTHASSLLVTA